MAIEFRLPELGENIESGQVTALFVAAGDQVAKDQPVLEIETDKAAIEVPSPASGTITRLNVAEGDEVSVGQVVLVLEAQEGEAAVPAPEPAAPATATEPPPVESPAPSPEPAAAATATPAPAPQVPVLPREGGRRAAAAPSVRRLARELGVEIGKVPGTGPGGRISHEDVKAWVRQSMRLAPAPARPLPTAAPTTREFTRWGEVEREPISRLRRTIAGNLSATWATVPHVTNHDRADITELEEMRKRYGKRAEAAGGKLTVTALLLKVAAQALRLFPRFNASLDMEAEEIVYNRSIHIGVAVDTERGLLVPVIRDADRKSIIHLAVELNQLAGRARDRKLELEEMQGGTFTITNLGGIGGTGFTPIVNAPEPAILGVARSSIEPVWRDGQFVPRLMLPLSLSYDHRLIDGADGARFLRWIADALEKPLLTLLEEA